MKRMISLGIAWLISLNLLAAPMFNLVESGQAGSVNVSLCLNAYGPLSCENHQISHLTLSVRTLIPHYIYRKAGIKINTPGYAVDNGAHLCRLLATGYCPKLFQNDRETLISIVAIPQNQYTLGGAIAGLNSRGLILENTINHDTLAIKAFSTSFTFKKTIGAGSSYHVIIKAQPQGLMCHVHQGSGQNVEGNINDITLACGLPNAVVGTEKGNVVLSFDDGLTWKVPTTPHATFPVNSVFATTRGANGTIYAGSADSFVYTSDNLGLTWTKLLSSIDGTAVNGIYILPGFVDTIFAVTTGGTFAYATPNSSDPWNLRSPGHGVLESVVSDPHSGGVYIGTGSGEIYQSFSPYTTWVLQPSLPSPSTSSPVMSMGLSSTSQLYANTQDENVYLLDAGSWSWYAQTVYRFFSVHNNDHFYTGTQDGEVLWLNAVNTLNQLGFVEHSALNGVFFFH